MERVEISAVIGRAGTKTSAIKKQFKMFRSSFITTVQQQAESLESSAYLGTEVGRVTITYSATYNVDSWVRAEELFKGAEHIAAMRAGIQIVHEIEDNSLNTEYITDEVTYSNA